MKKSRSILSLMLIALSGVLIIGCSKDDDAPAPYKVTQSEVDMVSDFVGDYTGGAMAHGGPEGTLPDSTVRSVFSSMKDISGTIPVGTIITKNTYKRDADGKKTDQLYVSFVMVKREAGYNTEGGDWEYMMIPYDQSVDYSAHPYGMIPTVEGDGRGKLAMCMACHATAGGKDFLFVND